MAEQRLEEIRKIRLERREQLAQSGVNPYPSKLAKTPEKISSVREKMDQTVVAAGRLMSFREHGNIIFADLKDESGNIQLFFQKKELGDKFKLLRKFDIGDFMLAEGKVFETQAGEITINVSDHQLLVKTVRPLPSTFHGLKDVEERYRKRYLDMLLNEDVKERLTARSKIITAMRKFLDARGFVEVETPTLQPIYGGGFAKPFSTHHNALDSNFYLRISDEMYLKRMIVGGFEKVYEITKVFRNEGVDHDHNPEFTMFEAQVAYEDYNYGMDLTEEMIETIAKEVFGTTDFKYGDMQISVVRPWKRMKVVEAIKKFTGVDPLSWNNLEEAKESTKSIKEIKKEKLSELDKMQKIGQVIAFVFEEAVEERLIQPTMIYDYPIEISPLAKKCIDPRFTQRFEVFAFSSELGNNYSELNDPVDLKQRFLDEKDREKAGFDEAHQTDYDYLEAIEYGFPPTCGFGIGIDRLVMMLTNAANIREVIAFPTLKPLDQVKEKKQNTTSFSERDLLTFGSIEGNVKKRFSGISFAFTIIKDVNISKENQELEKFKNQILERKKDLKLEEIENIHPISVYRKMFKETGVKLGSRRPSPEALLRRIIQGKGLYKVNTAVDAYNMAVVEMGVGLGGFDFDQIEFPVTLRFSEVGEKVLLLGDESPTVTESGELVYADNEKLLTLDLNYRDNDKTKITKETKNIILFADGGPGIDPNDVTSALQKGAKYIQEYCGGEIGEVVLVK